jgi:hypothetical protein
MRFRCGEPATSLWWVLYLGSLALLSPGIVAAAPGAGLPPEAGVAVPSIGDCGSYRLLADVDDPDLRRRMTRACAASTTLRVLMLALDRAAGLRVQIRVARILPAGAPRGLRGATQWDSPPIRVVHADGGERWSGAVRCQVVPVSGWEAVLGHELFHALELARYGDIRRAPGAVASRDPQSHRFFETAGAQAFERAVRAELASAR